MITPRVTLQAVLVLYKRSLADSAAYAAWESFTAAHPDFAARVDLMVLDNTPGTPNAPPAGYAGSYISQPQNPGLAASYERALIQAENTGATWLLLLDHDTVLTEQYLAELDQRSQAFSSSEDVVAIVPKLLEHGKVQSPNPGMTAKRQPPIPVESRGMLANDRMHIFNSGALLRVPSLRKIGGFPQEFWLDSLDHAVFHLLREQGGRVFLMDAALEHTLSSNTAPDPKDSAYIARHKNTLAADALFYKRYGTPDERRWYRQRLLRRAAYAALRRRDFGTAWRNFRAALAVRSGS